MAATPGSRPTARRSAAFSAAGLVGLATAALAAGAGAMPSLAPGAAPCPARAETATAHRAALSGVKAIRAGGGAPATVDFGSLPAEQPGARPRGAPPARKQPGHARAAKLKQAAVTGCVPRSRPASAAPARP